MNLIFKWIYRYFSFCLFLDLFWYRLPFMDFVYSILVVKCVIINLFVIYSLFYLMFIEFVLMPFSPDSGNFFLLSCFTDQSVCRFIHFFSFWLLIFIIVFGFIFYCFVLVSTFSPFLYLLWV